MYYPLVTHLTDLGTSDATSNDRCTNHTGGVKMKKIVSSIVATLAVVAFTGIVFAAEPDQQPVQPAIKADVTPSKPEVKEHHHKKHHKKHHRHHVKKTAQPHEASANPAPSVPPAN